MSTAAQKRSNALLKNLKHEQSDSPALFLPKFPILHKQFVKIFTEGMGTAASRMHLRNLNQSHIGNIRFVLILLSTKASHDEFLNLLTYAEFHKYIPKFPSGESKRAKANHRSWVPKWPPKLNWECRCLVPKFLAEAPKCLVNALFKCRSWVLNLYATFAMYNGWQGSCWTPITSFWKWSMFLAISTMEQFAHSNTPFCWGLYKVNIFASIPYSCKKCQNSLKQTHNYYQTQMP